MTTPMNPPPPPPPRRGGPTDRPTPPRPPAFSPERSEQAVATFNLALEQPTASRAAFVAQACGGDDALQARVEELLAAHEKAAGFLDDDAPLSPELEEQLARLKPEKQATGSGRTSCSSMRKRSREACTMRKPPSRRSPPMRSRLPPPQQTTNLKSNSQDPVLRRHSIHLRYSVSWRTASQAIACSLLASVSLTSPGLPGRPSGLLPYSVE
jgi:hypothetical protein